MCAIQATDQFLRQAKKVFKKQGDLKTRFAGLTAAPAKDHFQSALELHPLSGKLEWIWAAGLACRYRFLDIGTHDEVYKNK